jgi:hypothetical protein
LIPKDFEVADLASKIKYYLKSSLNLFNKKKKKSGWKKRFTRKITAAKK